MKSKNKIQVLFKEYCSVYNLDFQKLIEDKEYIKSLINENGSYYILVDPKIFEIDKTEQPIIREKLIEVKGEEGCYFLLSNFFLMLLTIASIVLFFVYRDDSEIKMISIFAFTLSLPVWIYTAFSDAESKIENWHVALVRYSKKYLVAMMVINIIIFLLIIGFQIPGMINAINIKAIGIIIIILLVLLLVKRN